MVYQAKTNQENRKREEKDIEAAQQLTVRFLSYRSRSSEEVRNKLAERGFSPRTIQKTIARIKELGYLNDYDYAHTFGRSCIEHKLWGAARIRDALQQKGIVPDIITTVLQELAQEHDFNQVARRALDNKFPARGAPGLTGEKRRQKAISYLRRRGFCWSTIAAVIDPGYDTVP